MDSKNLCEKNLADSWHFLINIEPGSFDISVSIQHHPTDLSFDPNSDLTSIITFNKAKIQ